MLLSKYEKNGLKGEKPYYIKKREQRQREREGTR
jgi:hypothetical protein